MMSVNRIFSLTFIVKKNERDKGYKTFIKDIHNPFQSRRHFEI